MIRPNDYESICNSAKSGQPCFVENEKLGYSGKVVSCSKGSFVVEVFDHEYRWPREVCTKTGAENPLGPPSDR